MKTGAEHLRSLQDGRQVYLDGELVDDVTTSGAYRNAVAAIGRLYDAVAEPQNAGLMTYRAGDGSGPYNRIWQLPRSHDE